MPRPLPRQFCVEIDDREKKPLLFPEYIKLPTTSAGTAFVNVRITTKSTRMDAGDYRLQGYDYAGIERKSGQTELITNLTTNDYPRFYRALCRFATTYEQPVLLIESTPSLLLAKPYLLPSSSAKGGLIDPAFLVHRLSELTARLHLHLILAGQSRSESQRRTLGTFMVHTLIGLSFLDILGIQLDKPLEQ